MVKYVLFLAALVAAITLSCQRSSNHGIPREPDGLAEVEKQAGFRIRIPTYLGSAANETPIYSYITLATDDRPAIQVIYNYRERPEAPYLWLNAYQGARGLGPPGRVVGEERIALEGIPVDLGFDHGIIGGKEAEFLDSVTGFSFTWDQEGVHYILLIVVDDKEEALRVAKSVIRYEIAPHPA